MVYELHLNKHTQCFKEQLQTHLKQMKKNRKSQQRSRRYEEEPSRDLKLKNRTEAKNSMMGSTEERKRQREKRISELNQ